MSKGNSRQKITPASHGDELDVLENIFNISKKSGKKILRDDQINTLMSSGRISEKDLIGMDNICYPNETLNDEGLNENKVRSAFKIINNLLLTMDRHKKLLYSKEAWDEYDEKGRFFAREELFKKIYGVSSKEFGMKIYQVLV